MDLTQSIEPKSDQLNAEDLLSGPRTFTIDKVQKGSAEQPVDVHLVEFPGRPFKPSKTVRRLMVAAWGVDSATYAGQRMTLYRDPAVKFGGMDVGGIRVSHMTGIDKALKIALAVSKGRRAMYVVQPLDSTAPEPPPEPGHGRRRTMMLLRLGQTGRKGQEAADFISAVCDRTVRSPADLTELEIEAVIAALAEPEPEPPTPDDEAHGDAPARS